MDKFVLEVVGKFSCRPCLLTCSRGLPQSPQMSVGDIKPENCV